MKRITDVTADLFSGKRKLVSVEMMYMKQVLGKSSTTEHIKEELLKLTGLSWVEMCERMDQF